MLKIVFKDGNEKRYREKEYTDYWYNGSVFVIIHKKRWVGIYNMDCVATVEVKGYKKG